MIFTEKRCRVYLWINQCGVDLRRSDRVVHFRPPTSNDPWNLSHSFASPSYYRPSADVITGEASEMIVKWSPKHSSTFLLFSYSCVYLRLFTPYQNSPEWVRSLVASPCSQISATILTCSGGTWLCIETYWGMNMLPRFNAAHSIQVILWYNM